MIKYNSGTGKKMLAAGYICLLAFSMTIQQCDQSNSDDKIMAESARPNIILIMVDDLGYAELGSYGQETIKTPYLDQMAKEGLRFTDFYAGSTVCAPSRDAIMTGRHTGNTHVRGNFAPDYLEGGTADLPLPDDTKTIGNYMQEGGYHTAKIGKWGLGETPHSVHGFDYTFGYHSQLAAHDYYPPYLWEKEERYPLAGNEDDGQEIYAHDLLTDKALEYIEARGEDEQFFLYLPYTIPHGPFNPPNDAPYTEKDWPQEKKNIAAMITLLDRDMGRILQLLQERGMDEHTLVMFTSDNGPTDLANRHFNSSGPFRGIKRDLYEGGIRVPMIAWWPGMIDPGGVTDHISAAWDFLPTIMELAGLEPPEDIDGISMVPEFLGEEQPEHDFLYWENYNYNWNWNPDDEESLPRNWLDKQAVRYSNWKAVRNDIFQLENAPWELYDLDNDLGENHDLADDYPEVIRVIEEFCQVCCTTSPYYPYEK